MEGPKPVAWIKPTTLATGEYVFLDRCEAPLITPEVVRWHREVLREGAPRCRSMAKVDYRGRKFCLKHARIAALYELAGDPRGDI